MVLHISDPDCDRTVYRLVHEGKEVTRHLTGRPNEAPPGRFRNTLSTESLERIQRVVETARSLVDSTPTVRLLQAAGAEVDRKGALGALRMMDVEEIIHARSAGRRQLVWYPGPRPPEVPLAKMVDRPRYELLRYILRTERRWSSTDRLIWRAEFDVDMEGAARLDGRTDRDLPVTYFADYGKNARKYVLGALKALYWLERVAWRNYSCQAIDWLWVGPAPSQETRVRPVPQVRAISDPYLTRSLSRDERLRDLVAERKLTHRLIRQRWIDSHHPEKAAEYRSRAKEARQGEALRKERLA
jgi:hypothetical protein